MSKDTAAATLDGIAIRGICDKLSITIKTNDGYLLAANVYTPLPAMPRLADLRERSPTATTNNNNNDNNDNNYNTTANASHTIVSPSMSSTIIISSAMSISQHFYHNLATYLATVGFRVITFDYRGILDSKKLNSKQWNLGFANMGMLDLTAVIVHCLKSYVTPNNNKQY